MFVGRARQGKFLGIFAYDTAKDGNRYDEVRNDLADKFSSGNLDNVNMIHVFQEDFDNSSASSIKVASINVKGGTWLAFCNGLVTALEKKTFYIYDVCKNKHAADRNQHISTPEYYSTSNGYSYHFE